MKKIISPLVISLAALLSASANADAYFGIGYSKYEISGTLSVPVGYYGGSVNADISADANVIEGVFGFNQNPYLAWEARLGLGLGSDSVNMSVYGYSDDIGDYKINSLAGLYIRPQITNEILHAYGLLGYTSFSEKIDGEDGNDSGVTFGLGAGWIFGQNSLNVEWKKTDIGDGLQIDGLSFLFQRSF